MSKSDAEDSASDGDAETTAEDTTKEEKVIPVSALEVEDGEESQASAAMRKAARSQPPQEVSSEISGRCLLLWLVLLTFGVGFGIAVIFSEHLAAGEDPVASQAAAASEGLKTLDTLQTQADNKIKELQNRLAASEAKNVEFQGLLTALQAQLDGLLIPMVPSVVSAFANDALYITQAAVPSKVSQLLNDANFTTSADAISVPSSLSAFTDDVGFALSSSIPTKLSDLDNDSNFVLSSNLATVATSGSYADLANKPTLATIATSADYNDLANQPDLSKYAVSSTLATVATSGSYADLANKPTLATIATSADYNDLANQPDLSKYAVSSTLATVATSGDYNDLLNQPDLNSLILSDLNSMVPLPVFKQSCVWSATNTAVEGSCTPPPCPANNFTDLSAGSFSSYPHASVYVANSGDWFLFGSSTRPCEALVSGHSIHLPSCSWSLSNPSVPSSLPGTCTPPACPLGFQDLSDGQLSATVESAAYIANSGNWYVWGSLARVCVKP